MSRANSKTKTPSDSESKTLSKTSIKGIIGVVVFIALAVFTYYFGSEDGETPNTVEPTTVTQGQLAQSEDTLPKNKNVIVTESLEGDPYEELESLVGLTSVKEEVKSLSNFVKIQKKRKEQGLKVSPVSYHCVFTGSPGTGKTTVARLLARIYKDLGVVKRGQLVETDRSGLIAEYVGQTAVKTNAVIDSAINGVLFIDEAYALLDGKGGYGDEAIATLLKRMEDDRDSLVVIVAGYTDEMKRFIDSNPGLQSRFTRYINFPDYTADELYKIFDMRVKKYGYALDTDASDYLMQSFNETLANKSRNFGNGRYVRNLFEQAITNQANRVAKIANPSKKELSQITLEDISLACQTVKK